MIALASTTLSLINSCMKNLQSKKEISQETQQGEVAELERDIILSQLPLTCLLKCRLLGTKHPSCPGLSEGDEELGPMMKNQNTVLRPKTVKD